MRIQTSREALGSRRIVLHMMNRMQVVVQEEQPKEARRRRRYRVGCEHATAGATS